MKDWAALEIAPWRGLGLRESDVRAGLEAVAGRDPSLCVFAIRDGVVTLARSHEARMAPDTARFMLARAATFGAFLQEVVSRHRIDLSLTLGARMADRAAEEREVPVFCFHKQRYHRDILLPDLDFATFGFYEDEAFRDRLSFANKRRHAFFVGATTGGIVGMARVEAGAHPRIRAASAFRDEPGVTFEISEIVQCDSEETRRAVERLVPMAPHRRSWQEQFAHRYLLSMDGNGATWSRTAVALASDSVLVRYASPYLLHYFHGLEPWVHYVPIRRDAEVVELVARADLTAERDAGIAAAGRRFAEAHLSREAVSAYMASLLREYGSVIRAG